jgi:hypothetical protein
MDAEGCRMALDDREQRILEEIERNLYAEDPKLAQTVAKADFGARNKRRQRLASIGFVVGLVIMLGTFTRYSYLAGIGFILMVASAATIAMSIKAARVDRSGPFSVSGWMGDVGTRWRRER